MFEKDKFIVPYSSGDKVIYLKDIYDHVVYKIFPFNILISYIQGYKLLIKSRGTDNILELAFIDNSEASEALTIFQTHLDNIKKELNK